MYFGRWMDQRDLRPFLAFGLALGFEQFELGHALSLEAVATLQPGSARIAAVHHPCPAASCRTEPAHLTAAAPEARHRAMEAIAQTIATAQRLRAPVVVLHLGYVDDRPGLALARDRFELESRYGAGQQGWTAYEAARQRLCRRLAELESEHVERAIAALQPLLERAREAGVRLAIETAYHADGLPTVHGMRQLLAALSDGQFGAWLDTGHVMARQNLGLETFGEWFDAVGDHWLGVHFHDAVGLRDHLAPGQGTVPFATIAEHVPAHAIRSCEVDWYLSPEELRAGALHLLHAGCG